MPSNVSPLDSLSAVSVAKITEYAAAGTKWTDIAEWVTNECGIVTNRMSLAAWCKRNGIAQGSGIVAVEPAVSLQAAKLAALEAENRKLRNANKAMRESADKDTVMAETIRLASESAFSVTVPPTPYRRKATKYAPQQFLAHISDAHYGEVVNPELASGIEYNSAIALARVEYLGKKIERYAEIRPYPIEVLHLAILGDMLSGNQHDDLALTNEQVMADQMCEMGDALYRLIVRLRQSGRFGEVRAYILRGNHPRAHKVPQHKAPHDSWEYGMARYVARAIELTHGLSGVSVATPRGTRLVVDVAGRRVCLTHGDGVKAASFAGIPWYAMKSKRDALQSMYHALKIEPVDQISMGHFHQHIHWPSDCNIVVNGSIKGGDEYIQDTRYAHTPPMQIVQDWHPVKGLTSTNYIDLATVDGSSE